MAYLNHVCGPLRIIGNPTPGGDVILDQVEGQSLSAGLSVRTAGTGGQVYSTFTGIMAAQPRFSLSTEAIAQFLTAVSVEGLVLASPRGFEVFNQKVEDTTGKRATGGAHEKIAGVAALIIPRRLSCAQGQVARLDFDIIGISSDGMTHPFTPTQNQSLPAVVGVATQFTLGPVKINGSAVDGIQDVTIDFGLREVIKAANGHVYPTRGHFEQISPRITIRSDDAAVLNTLALTGLAQTATDSIIYLRKMLKNAIRTPDITAEHISFSIDETIWTPLDKGGSHPGVLATGFQCEPVYDGTNAPIVANLATAIS